MGHNLRQNQAKCENNRRVGTNSSKLGQNSNENQASWDKTGQVGPKIGKSGQSEDKLGHNQEMKGYYGRQRISQWNPV